MFVRIKRGGNEEHPHDYLQIVEAYRDTSGPKQRVIANLGRLDLLVGSGQIDGLIASLGRFAQQLRVLDASRVPQVGGCVTRLWGPALLFGRLWERQGIGGLLRKLSAGRRFEFDIERVVFAMALQRLCAPGSDLQGSAWAKGVEADGLDALQLQYFYRAAGFLFDVREELERELFLRDRDLFSQEVDLLFVDTTSLYVYRDIETEWRRHGYSRDRRGDLPQFVLCVAVDRVGWPVAWEILPGNTMDRAAFLKMIERLRTRLKIRRVVIVADRAMMDKGTLAALINDGNAPFEFILGCRMRQSRQVREDVLGSDGEYQKVAENLWVREVRVAGSRYVVCYNPEEAKRDAALREHIVANLQEELKRRHKEVISNKGFKRFLTFDRDAVQIDQAAVEADACFDGAFVLHTNTQLPADQVAKSYKSLWRVERTFREEKSTLQVRPIFHHRDDTSIGHIVASFLALRLEVDLQRRLDEKHIDVSWPDLMRELSAVQAVHIELDARAWRIRTDLQGAGYAAFQAAGVRPPARVTPLPGTDM